MTGSVLEPVRVRDWKEIRFDEVVNTRPKCNASKYYVWKPIAMVYLSTRGSSHDESYLSMIQLFLLYHRHTCERV